jgi:hypothetical protein
VDSLISLLRDPALRTVLAVIALCVTVVVFLVGQWWWRRKALSYTVLETRLLTVHDEIKGRVEILVDGVQTIDVALAVITLTNAGFEPIRAADFERALKFDCGEAARVLSSELVATKPSNLKPVTNFPLNEFMIEPLLLNRGDWLKVKLLVNQLGNISVDGRIVGVRCIARVSGDAPRAKWAIALAIGGLAGSILTWATHQSPKVILAYKTTSMKVEQTSGLRMQIAGKDEPVWLHKVEFQAVQGDVEQMDIRFDFGHGRLPFGQIQTEAPSPSHKISCQPIEDITRFMRCTMGPLKKGDGFFKITMATGSESNPDIMTATRDVEIFSVTLMPPGPP